MKIYDISQELLSCDVYEGDPAPEGTQIKNVKDDGYNLSCLSLCAHNGTHIDAPYHFLDDGNTIDKMDISIFRIMIKYLQQMIIAQSMHLY